MQSTFPDRIDLDRALKRTLSRATWRRPSTLLESTRVHARNPYTSFMRAAFASQRATRERRVPRPSSVGSVGVLGRTRESAAKSSVRVARSAILPPFNVAPGQRELRLLGEQSDRIAQRLGPLLDIDEQHVFG